MARAPSSSSTKWARQQSVAKIELASALRQALQNDELQVHYQPIVELDDHSIRGVEALARWTHPTRGPVPPCEFIAVAEETGLVISLGEFVLRTACLQVARWRAVSSSGIGTRRPSRPQRALELSVNVSGHQVNRPRFADVVASALDESGLDPQALCLEITESVVMDDSDITVAALRRLLELGVKLAIDDFGTGYSGLALLRRHPVQILKIDKTFVDGLGTNARDHAIVKTILDLAPVFGFEAVAEGVENTRQLDILHALGCKRAQRFLWSRPVDAEQMEAVLTVGHGRLPDPRVNGR